MPGVSPKEGGMRVKPQIESSEWLLLVPKVQHVDGEVPLQIHTYLGIIKFS